jgi:hypothetical protein
MANTTTATCLPLFPSLEMAWRPSSKCCATTRSSLPARRTVAAGRVGHRWGTPEAKAALAILASARRGGFRHTLIFSWCVDAPARAAGGRPGGALLSNYPCHSHEYRLFAIRTSAGPRQPLRILIAGNHDEATMGILFVWVIEFIKLLGRRRLHPLNAECPICHQMVRLHYNKAGRRHLLAHARACSLTLYEGARYCVHYTAKIKCLGSGTLAKFDPRPNENQHFKLPKFLELEGWSTSSSERGDVRLRTRTDRQSGHSHSAVP